MVNFRNYAATSLGFSQNVVVFSGPNGSGKTNVLDAIHYLCFCKSFLNPVDSQNILDGESFFVVQGLFDRKGKDEQVYCGVKRGQKKNFKYNGKEYERLAEHIGLFPLVVISPQDMSLIIDGSDVRRRFADSVISQFNKAYLEHLIRYNRILQQRNAFLRSGRKDHSMLDVFDHQLYSEAGPIVDARHDFIGAIEPLFNHYYNLISGSREPVTLNYQTRLKDSDFLNLMQLSREKDFLLQYTTAGPHKDDFEMLMKGFPLRKFASQGQQKSFLIALKLAEFDLIQKLKGIKPLLLLDDIFDKLDEERITALISLVSQHHFGQLFITDSHPERVGEILKKIDCNFESFNIENGTTALYEAKIE